MNETGSLNSNFGHILNTSQKRPIFESALILFFSLVVFEKIIQMATSICLCPAETISFILSK